MRSGDLRHVVDLQEPARAKGASGAPKPSEWRTFSTRRASIEPLYGRELMLARQVESRVTHKVTLRCEVTSPVLTEHRIVFRDGTRTRVLNILSIVNVEERDRELLLSCVEDTTRTGV